MTDSIGGRCSFGTMDWYCVLAAGHDGPHESDILSPPAPRTTAEPETPWVCACGHTHLTRGAFFATCQDCGCDKFQPVAASLSGTPAPTDRVQEIEARPCGWLVVDPSRSPPYRLLTDEGVARYEQAKANEDANRDRIVQAAIGNITPVYSAKVVDALLARVRSLEADADRWLAVTRAVELFSAPIELIDADDMSYLIVAGDERLGAGASLAAAADCIVDDLRKSEALFARAAHPLEAPANGQ